MKQSKRFYTDSNDFKNKEIESIVFLPFKGSDGKEYVNLKVNSLNSASILVLTNKQVDLLEKAIKDFKEKKIEAIIT